MFGASHLRRRTPPLCLASQVLPVLKQTLDSTYVFSKDVLSPLEPSSFGAPSCVDWLRRNGKSLFDTLCLLSLLSSPASLICLSEFMMCEILSEMISPMFWPVAFDFDSIPS